MIQSIVRATINRIATIRNFVVLGFYLFALIASVVFATLVGFDFEVKPLYWHMVWHAAVWAIPLKMISLWVFGQFRGLLMFFRMPDLVRLFWATIIPSLFLFGLYQFWGTEWVYPRRVILLDFIFTIVGLAAFRMLLRSLRERYLDGNGSARVVKVAVYGSDDTAARIAAELLAKPGFGKRPVIFIDGDAHHMNRPIHGIKVVSDKRKFTELRDSYNIAEILIAKPNISPASIQLIRDQAVSAGLKVEIVPGFEEFLSGRVTASRIREVSIEDLLPREQVELNAASIDIMVRSKTVMVTGGGGSIGSELCRQILARSPKRLLVVEQSEPALYLIDRELRQSGYAGLFVPIIADVCDLSRMQLIMEHYLPQMIFHAAAHKHVPMMEYQPGEAIKNNTLGTAGLAELASSKGLERFVLVSTDKAINPTSVMGASKRLAEIAMQAVQAKPGNRTMFSAVRFGNVMGSSGSVIPLFRSQIATGGPVTVTHREVTRYFMTIPEAVGLVLQSATLAEGGDIFVLDMGEPVKVLQLAEQMIRLSGYRPYVDIQIQFVGLRPGEKLFEELQHQIEAMAATTHPRVMRMVSELPEPAVVFSWLEEFRSNVDDLNPSAHRNRIQSLVPEYAPYIC